MGNVVVPRHVFMCFSWKDKHVVQDVQAHLQNAGIPVWTDYMRLAPGTPEWNKAVHQAISESFAVVLVASPNSAKSPHVKVEMSLARAFRRPVAPAWIEGAQWSASTPAGMADVKYLDLREDRYVQGVSRLAKALRDLIDSSIPKHYLLSPLRTRLQEGDLSETIIAAVPPGCVCVELSYGADTDSGESPGSGVVIKLSQYPDLQPLIDDLHAHYLSDLFRADTYGADWVLAEDHADLGRLVMPWNWLSCADRDSYRLDKGWSSTASPATCGLVEGTNWRVVPARGLDAFGLAVDDIKVFHALMSGREAVRTFVRNRYLAVAPASTIPPGKFAMRLVMHRSADLLEGPERKDYALFQTKVPVPTSELEYWMGLQNPSHD